MDKILITGFSGFVGHHFLQYLYDNYSDTEVYGIDLREPTWDYKAYEDKMKVHFKNVNLLDIDQMRELFTFFRPDYVLHLASFSSVAYSWKYPAESFSNNTDIFLKLATVVRELVPECRVLSIGSSEEYGNVDEGEIPIKETNELRPTSPYAVARISQEMLSKLFSDSFGMNIILTRSFNHIGPWQDDRFVVPSFVKRIKDIKLQGKSEGTIETGDTTIVRDFVDVRDVVRAYYMLLKNGKSGEVYNICSGTGRPLRQIIDMIADELDMKIDNTVNSDFVRPNDNRVIIGDYSKIKSELGWEPEISFEQTIKDIVNQC
jgi:GDP-4-dehydro-6-deoxy-D-mannose reductase